MLLFATRRTQPPRAPIAMHAILFSLKRTYLSILHRTRRLAAIFGITPARFDMLYAISKHSDFSLSQARLSRILGVSGATVSRMAESLENLGLITRYPSLTDGRCLDLKLTSCGEDRLQLVTFALLDGNAMDLVVTLAFAFCWTAPSSITELLHFESHLYIARRNLEDPATLRYPWHPDG